MSIHVYVDGLNYDCGCIRHTFGLLASGCIHMHVNCRLECIRHIHVYDDISDDEVASVV